MPVIRYGGVDYVWSAERGIISDTPGTPLLDRLRDLERENAVLVQLLRDLTQKRTPRHAGQRSA